MKTLLQILFFLLLNSLMHAQSNLVAQFDSLINTSKIQVKRGEFPAAHASALFAIDKARLMNDSLRVAEAHLAVANADISNPTGNAGRAEAQLAAAYKIFNAKKNQPGLAKYYDRSGSFYFHNRYDLPNSLKQKLEALHRYEQLQDSPGVADVQGFLSMIYLHIGNYPEALKLGRQVIDYLRSSGDSVRLAYELNRITDVYAEVDSQQTGMTLAKESLKIYQLLGEKAPRFGVSWSHGSIGEMYWGIAMKELDSNRTAAESSFKQALQHFLIRFELEKTYGISLRVVLFEIGNTYLELSKISGSRRKVYLDSAEVFTQQGINLAKEINFIPGLAAGYKELSVIDSIRGNYTRALSHYKLHVLYNDSVLSDEINNKGKQIRDGYEAARKEEQIKILTTENQAAFAALEKNKTRKKLAISISLLLSFSGLVGFYLFRKKRALQAKQAMMSERLRISSDLHDEVGETLSALSVHSQFAKEQMEKQDFVTIENSLDHMQLSSSEMVNKLNDIVWLVNPEQDTVGNTVKRLEEYATDIAMDKDIAVTVELDDNLSHLKLNLKDRRNLYLICKEATRNIIENTHDTHFRMIIKKNGAMLECRLIVENGSSVEHVAFPADFMETTHQRAKDIGAVLHSESLDQAASVTLISLKVF